MSKIGADFAELFYLLSWAQLDAVGEVGGLPDRKMDLRSTLYFATSRIQISY